MTRKSKREIERELEGLASRYEVGDDSAVVLLRPDGPLSDPLSEDIPDASLDLEDIQVEQPTEGGATVDKVVVPHHRPPEYQRGVIAMTYSEAASLWKDMSEETRQRELELRLERGEPIPPLLQD